jgi:hypothetical protein
MSFRSHILELIGKCFYLTLFCVADKKFQIRNSETNVNYIFIVLTLPLRLLGVIMYRKLPEK